MWLAPPCLPLFFFSFLFFLSRNATYISPYDPMSKSLLCFRGAEFISFQFVDLRLQPDLVPNLPPTMQHSVCTSNTADQRCTLHGNVHKLAKLKNNNKKTAAEKSREFFALLSARSCCPEKLTLQSGQEKQ